MKFSRMITAVDAHTEGHPERVVIGGVPPVPGVTIMEKVRYVRENWDHLRTFLVHEPRGHSAMHASIYFTGRKKSVNFRLALVADG